MIKDCIGRCRATSYDLPKDVMHVYGYIQEKAKAGHKPDRHNKPPFDGPYGFVPKTGTEPLTHTIEGRYMGQGVKAKEESPPKKHFCMKRFKNIKSRLNLDQ